MDKFLSVKLKLVKGITLLKGKVLSFLALNNFFSNCYCFLKYLGHSYDLRQYSPLHLSNNFRLLQQVKVKGIWISSRANGSLKELSTAYQKIGFCLLNLVLFGAPQARLLNVINLTFITFCIEIYNPLDKKSLSLVILKKTSYVERLIKGIKRINDSPWDSSAAAYHIDAFQRSSLVQMQISKHIQAACRNQKEPEVVKNVKKGLEKGVRPILVTVGLSGAYWMRGEDRSILGLFKPFDEEIRGPNNPIGPSYQGAIGQRRARAGIRVGEAACHEVAAYIVDHFFGFGLVPRTYFAIFSNQNFFLAQEDIYKGKRAVKTKYGSFQEYVEGFEPIHHLTKEKINAMIPLDEFQLLVVLDVIIGNSDRNTGNILFREGKIAAIDHGLCFPDVHETLMTWHWKGLPQGREPLYPAIKEVIFNFPYEELFALLKKKCFLSTNALDRMRERVVLFQVGIEKGYTPYMLAELLQDKYLFPLTNYNLSLKKEAEKVLTFYIQGLVA